MPGLTGHLSKPKEPLQSAGGGEKCSTKRLRPNHFPPPPALLPLSVPSPSLPLRYVMPDLIGHLLRWWAPPVHEATGGHGPRRQHHLSSVRISFTLPGCA